MERKIISILLQNVVNIHAICHTSYLQLYKGEGDGGGGFNAEERRRREG